MTCKYIDAKAQALQKIVMYEVPRPLTEYPDFNYPSRRSLHYFRCEAASQMHAPFQSALWIDHVVQLAEGHAFVMSALLALSSMHESYTQLPDQRELYHQNAMYHYSNAMKEISQVSSSEMPVHAVLVSSILFYSLECLRGLFHSAMLHIQYGVRIISQQGPSQPQPSSLVVSLHRDFLSIQNQVMELGSPGISRAYDAIRGFNPTLLQGFQSVDDALYHVEVIYNEIYCLLDYAEKASGPDPNHALSTDLGFLYERISGRVSQWNANFANLELVLGGGVDARQRQSILVLRIYQLVIKFVLKCLFTTKGFGEFDPDIQMALDLIQSFLQNEEPIPKDGKRNFSLSLGVLPPLFMFASRSNHAPFKEKCLDLLGCYKRREGLWDNLILLQLANRVNAKKDELAAAGNNNQVRISNISFIGDTTCQVDIAVTEPVSDSTYSEQCYSGTKRIEIVYLG